MINLLSKFYNNQLNKTHNTTLTTAIACLAQFFSLVFILICMRLKPKKQCKH